MESPESLPYFKPSICFTSVDTLQCHIVLLVLLPHGPGIDELVKALDVVEGFVVLIRDGLFERANDAHQESAIQLNLSWVAVSATE